MSVTVWMVKIRHKTDRRRKQYSIFNTERSDATNPCNQNVRNWCNVSEDITAHLRSIFAVGWEEGTV